MKSTMMVCLNTYTQIFVVLTKWKYYAVISLSISFSATGFIDLNGFLSVYGKILQNEQDEEDLRQAFRVLDKNRKGEIDVDDLRWILKELGDDLTEEEIDEMIRDTDRDGSGFVDFDGRFFNLDKILYFCSPSFTDMLGYFTLPKMFIIWCLLMFYGNTSIKKIFFIHSVIMASLSQFFADCFCCGFLGDGKRPS